MSSLAWSCKGSGGAQVTRRKRQRRLLWALRRHASKATARPGLFQPAVTRSALAERTAGLATAPKPAQAAANAKKRPARKTEQTARETIFVKRHSFDVEHRAPCSLPFNPQSPRSTGRYGNDAALIRQRQETPVCPGFLYFLPGAGSEQFLFEVALADAGTDARRRGYAQLQPLPRRQRRYVFALLPAGAGVLEALRIHILNAKMLWICFSMLLRQRPGAPPARQSMGCPAARYSLSLLRKVRTEMPKRSAACVLLPDVASSPLRIMMRSISCRGMTAPPDVRALSPEL